jgi:hypothetical protein
MFYGSGPISELLYTYRRAPGRSRKTGIGHGIFCHQSGQLTDQIDRHCPNSRTLARDRAAMSLSFGMDTFMI